MDKTHKRDRAKEKNTEVSLQGTINVTSKGVGYFEHDDYAEDIEIQPELLNKALNNDEVLVKVLRTKKNKRIQGEVVRVTKRAKTEFVGTLECEQGSYFLVPDDRRFYKDISLGKLQNMESGVKALVSLSRWDKKGPEGKLIKVLGKKGLHDVEMQSIIYDKGFETTFHADVEREAEHIAKTLLPIPQVEINTRRNFRDVTTFTIDPVDAKDFDDAISIRSVGTNIYEIGVHIADVSHYIRPHTKLDKEAQKRAFSVYLVDRTIPMLPEALSNGICSLKPDEDRLTFSVVFKIDMSGTILDRWFGKTIIHSAKRFSYEEAQKVLDARSGAHFESLHILNSIAHRLRVHKFAKGAIDFEKEEVKFELDSNGKPIRVYKKDRLDTHMLVEDYMLLANREVAEYIVKENKKRKIDGGAFIYRIHDTPNQDRLADLELFIKALGYDLESHDGKLTAKSIKKLLNDVTGKPEESLVKTATLRSMAKAIYATSNIGHFGLAFEHYTHFTSPIRRYPDLLVHRVLFEYLNGREIPKHELAFYYKMAIQSSEREVLAAEAERASIKYKQVEYMKEHIGEEFNGIISGVTEWGIYVEEVETKCEGMIKLRDLGDDFYALDQKNYRVVGEKAKKTYSLGDKIRFRVAGADMERRTLDFQLAERGFM